MSVRYVELNDETFAAHQAPSPKGTPGCKLHYELIGLQQSLQVVNADSFEKRAVQIYSGPGATINGILRHNRGGDDNVCCTEPRLTYRQVIEHMDKLFETHKLDHSVVVYRGIGHDARLLTKLCIGDIFVDKGFMSTSLSPLTSICFSDVTGTVHDPIIRLMKIFLPKETKAIHVDAFRDYNYAEHEIVLPRNTNLRLKSLGVKTGGQSYFGCQKTFHLYEFELVGC